jgi:putative flippase GtrA
MRAEMDDLALSPRRGAAARAAVLSRVPPIGVIVRFLVTGGSVAVLHLALVGGMVLLDVPIQIALVAAYLVSLCVHFTLNREWVFATRDGYAFGLSGQGIRYLVAAGTGYAGAAAGTALLPDALGVSEFVAFLIATAAMTSINFLFLHLWIFRSAPKREGAA